MAGRVKEIVATGFLVFRRFNEIQYLLLNASYEATLWTPPKGHVDPGESELETAFRETEEEAGLKKEHLKLVDKFQKTVRYNVRKGPKRVEYWLAELIDPNTPIVLSHEHVAYKWLNCQDAMRQSHFPEMQEVFQTAEQFIISSSLYDSNSKAKF